MWCYNDRISKEKYKKSVRDRTLPNDIVKYNQDIIARRRKSRRSDGMMLMTCSTGTM